MKQTFFVMAVLLGVCTLRAHPGRTDANGGHNDRKNGGYHYHGAGPSRSSTPSSYTSPTPSYEPSTPVASPVRVSAPQPTVVRTAPVVPDTKKAEIEEKVIAWQKKQAEAGSQSAQYNLAVRHLSGNGVEKDMDRAIALLEAAATQGHPQASKLLDEVLQEREKVAGKDSASGDSDTVRLQKENKLLKKENQQLRRLLAGEVAIQAVGNVPRTTPSLQPANLPSAAVNDTSGKSLSSTGKRHNSRCRYYDRSKPSGPTDGEACKICGG